MNRQLSARQLRIILSISLFVIVALMVGIATYSYHSLRSVAVNVAQTLADADAGQDNLQTLEKIQEQLENDKDVVARANSIVADSQSYQYQDQIITDLQNYAAKAGITITNFDFTSTTATTPSQTPAPQTAAPSGVKSTSVTVTLKNPINYDNLLRFLKSIEQNLTKMQVSKIGLSKSQTGSDVSSDVLTIEVYIR